MSKDFAAIKARAFSEDPWLARRPDSRVLTIYQQSTSKRWGRCEWKGGMSLVVGGGKPLRHEQIPEIETVICNHDVSQLQCCPFPSTPNIHLSHLQVAHQYYSSLFPFALTIGLSNHARHSFAPKFSLDMLMIPTSIHHPRPILASINPAMKKTCRRPTHLNPKLFRRSFSLVRIKPGLGAPVRVEIDEKST